ncbi:hypothetical protein GF360_01290 [candidate division WWE3 bacterium]|nr:hypothetical protein [candidate division WWE3 bacterium]
MFKEASFKGLDKLHALGVNALLTALLLGILAVPITSIGLAGFKSPASSTGGVLSAQDVAEPKEEERDPNEPDWKKLYFELVRKELAEESTESTESTESPNR